MKEKWHYWYFGDGKDRKYYRTKQHFIWRLFLRFAHEWFTPCDKCQKNFDEWRKRLWYRMNIEGIDAEHMLVKKAINYALCGKCRKQINIILESAEILLGNKDYEPLVELSKKWVEKLRANQHGTFEPIIEEITKKEYKQMKRCGW